MPKAKGTARVSKNTRSKGVNEAAAQPIELIEFEGIQGVSIYSPDDEFESKFNIICPDWAENYGETSSLFYTECKPKGNGWSPMRVFVSNEMIALGEENLYRRLETAALQKWTWTRPNGKPLGRLPTGFQFKIGAISKLLSRLHRFNC